MRYIPVTFNCPLCKEEVTVKTSISAIYISQGWHHATDITLSADFANAETTHVCPDPTQDKVIPT